MKLRHLSAAALLAQPSFPRISPDEEFVLRDWLREYGRLYDSFSIDVPVGAGASCVGDGDSPIERMWAAITRRRIDAVAYHGAAVDVVEAKAHATMKAVTQVRTYCLDFKRENPHVRSVRPVIVCRSAVPGVAALLMNLGGRCIELPAIVASRDDAPHAVTQESRNG